MFYLIYSFRSKKVSTKRRESFDELGDAKELSTKKLSFEDNSNGSLETEKPGQVLLFNKIFIFSVFLFFLIFHVLDLKRFQLKDVKVWLFMISMEV